MRSIIVAEEIASVCYFKKLKTYFLPNIVHTLMAIQTTFVFWAGKGFVCLNDICEIKY